ncbi:MAG: FAD-dependent oxidoreductase [Victivallales bacterium]|nr:FAD-dependent oxidoreductase [Victivallales bacterium]
MKYDTVIIGAGMSGFAAGIRLAHYEKKVLICESHSREGGLNSFYRRHGVFLETGLHAITNYSPKNGNKAMPLLKLLRQLRIPYEELQLREQQGSEIVFPEHRLEFENGFGAITEAIRREFPAEIDNFIALDRFLCHYKDVTLLQKQKEFCSGKEEVYRHIGDKTLADMLLCPLMYYGSSVPNDIDFGQMVLLYHSIFHEGFCRPAGRGIGTLLELLKKRYRDSGGELRMNCRVIKIVSEQGKATGVITDKGEFIAADNILSSAGAPETMALCEEPSPPGFTEREIIPGGMAFLETIAVMPPEFDSGSTSSVIFFNMRNRFDYRDPESCFDGRSGVICQPHCFRFIPGEPHPEPMIRVTALAGYRQWHELSPEQYRREKIACSAAALSRAQTILNCRDILDHARFTDTITPLTIERFTGHLHGAIYGSPVKLKSGKTHLSNLYLCGTDQGFLGITGAMLSGISIANQYLLM